MDAAARLKRLFKFNAWATRQVIGVLKNKPDLDEYSEALHLLGHLLNAEQIWYRRTIGQSSEDLDLWPEFDLVKCESISNSMPDKWDALLSEHREDPDTLISYQNTKGDSYDTKLSDILYHVIIHGQHHRAQIATLLRESGITPPATDFIYFSRQHN